MPLICIISGTISYIRHCTVNLRKTLRAHQSRFRRIQQSSTSLSDRRRTLRHLRFRRVRSGKSKGESHARENGAGRNGPLDGRTPDSDCRRSETVHRTWICFRRVSIFRDRICVPKKGYLPGRLGFSYSAFISRISPHAIIAPEFPEGWVVISSGCACMITALPITSSG